MQMLLTVYFLLCGNKCTFIIYFILSCKRKAMPTLQKERRDDLTKYRPWQPNNIKATTTLQNKGHSDLAE
jgi:hypothetical protein